MPINLSKILEDVSHARDNASEEVIIQLIKSKCIPVLVYGLEVCPLTKSDLKSLDFPVNRFFVKLFKTSNIQMVNDYQVYFGFDLPSVIIYRQTV